MIRMEIRSEAADVREPLDKEFFAATVDNWILFEGRLGFLLDLDDASLGKFFRRILMEVRRR